MLDFLFTRKKPEIAKDKELNEIYEKTIRYIRILAIPVPKSS